MLTTSLPLSLVAACLLAIVPAHPEKPRVSLPDHAVLKNCASDVDHGGLNVNTCLEVLAHQSGQEVYYGFRDWSKKQPGGSYPKKLTKQVAEYLKERKSHRKPTLLQYDGHDPGWLETQLECNWAVAVTDHGGPLSRYATPCCTMAVLLHLDKDWACLFDPNFAKPGSCCETEDPRFEWVADPRYEWVRRDVFLRRWRAEWFDGSSKGWAFVLNGFEPTKPELPCHCSNFCVCGCAMGLPCLCERPLPVGPVKLTEPLKAKEPPKPVKSRELQQAEREALIWFVALVASLVANAIICWLWLTQTADLQHQADELEAELNAKPDVDIEAERQSFREAMAAATAECNTLREQRDAAHDTSETTFARNVHLRGALTKIKDLSTEAL